MSQQYDDDRRFYIDDDPEGVARVVLPSHGNRRTAAQLPQLAATEFLTEHADVVGVRPEWFTGAALTGAGEAADLEDGGTAGIELRFDGEKRQFDCTTVAYQQTWRGLPVWRCGSPSRCAPTPPGLRTSTARPTRRSRSSSPRGPTSSVGSPGPAG